MGWAGARKRLTEPLDGLPEAQTVQVHHQVNGSAAALGAVPVDELGAGDREHSLGSMPLVAVVAVGLSATEPEHRFQGDVPDLIGQGPDLPKGHDPDLDRVHLDVAQFIDQEQVPAQIFLERLGLGVEGHRLVEFGDQVGKEDVTAGGALLDGVTQEAGGQAGFSTAGASRDTILMFHFCRKSTTVFTPCMEKKWRSLAVVPHNTRTR